jgi:EmrB/QacA subfamily drug resistance transporter
MNQDIKNPGNSYKWWVLVAISIANFSAALDMSIIVVSFPRLTDVFNTDASVIIWLAISFSIAELGLLLTLGLILCSISPNITMLIISRIVQGAGAAMTLTVGSAIVVAVFPEEQQGRAIGLFAMFTSVGLIAGPALGGVIIDYLDWQGIFYTRIPVGIITLIMALMIINEQKEPGTHLQLDYGGALTLLGGTGCLLLYLNLGSDWGYLSPTSLALATVAVVFLGTFIYLERRAAQPVLDIHLFKNRTFSMAGLTTFIQMTAGSTGPVLFPFFLIGGLLLSPSTVGMLMALIAVPPVIISPISGWFSDKIGNRIPMVVATSCFTAALFFGNRMNIETSVLDVALVMTLFGLGMGMFMAPNQSAIIATVPRRNLATAMGVANTMRLLGSATGTAIAGTLYAHQQSVKAAELALQDIAPHIVERLSVIESFQYVILLAAIISFVSIVTASLIGKQKKSSISI